MRPPIRYRILIADDHKLVAEACAKLLEADFEVLGTVSNGHAMIETATALKPDVIVVDVAMPLLNGLDAGQKVKAILPETKLVYMTMNPDPEIAAEAFNRGASAYLLKTCAASELLGAVRGVVRYKSYLSSAIKDEVNYLRWQHADFVVDKTERLTGRQREVLKLLIDGYNMREISKKLNIAYNTVCYHKYRIMRHLRAKRDADLVRFAVRNDIAGYC